MGEFHTLVEDVGSIMPPLVVVAVSAVWEFGETGKNRGDFFRRSAAGPDLVYLPTA